MSTVRIHTTQNVSLEYEIASLGDRIVATLIDYALYVVWAIFCVVVLPKAGLGSELYMSVIFLPTLLYFLACEVFLNGQTLGKKARHIRVVRLDGTRPGLGDYLLRWLLRPIEIVATFGGVALVTILLNGKGQRLGDLAAGTTVISLRPRPAQATPLGAEAQVLAGYQPVFSQAATLADHDVALIRSLMYQAMANHNYLVLNEVANKVKALTGIQTDLPDVPFLQTVLRDHAHLAAQ